MVNSKKAKRGGAMNPLYPRTVYEPENFLEERRQKVKRIFIIIWIFFAALAVKDILSDYLNIVLEEGRQIRAEREIKPPPPWH